MTRSKVKRVDQSGDLPLSRSIQDAKYSRVNVIGTTIADGYFELTFHPRVMPTVLEKDKSHSGPFITGCAQCAQAFMRTTKVSRIFGPFLTGRGIRTLEHLKRRAGPSVVVDAARTFPLLFPPTYGWAMTSQIAVQ